MSELRYDTLLLRREGLTRDVPAGDNEDLGDVRGYPIRLPSG